MLSGFPGFSAEESGSDYESMRERILSLSKRVEVLSVRLLSSLEATKAAHEKQKREIETLSIELSALRLELESSKALSGSLTRELSEQRRLSEERLQQATASAEASTKLREQLESSERSLASLSTTLAAYQKDVQKLSRLRKWGPLAGVVLFALGLGAGLLLG